MILCLQPLSGRGPVCVRWGGDGDRARGRWGREDGGVLKGALVLTGASLPSAASLAVNQWCSCGLTHRLPVTVVVEVHHTTCQLTAWCSHRQPFCPVSLLCRSIRILQMSWWPQGGTAMWLESSKEQCSQSLVYHKPGLPGSSYWIYGSMPDCYLTLYLPAIQHVLDYLNCFRQSS